MAASKDGTDHRERRLAIVTWTTLILFLATILPLVCTPGPDILFVLSQGLVAQRKGALLATIGICTGYLVHAFLATLGLAAVVAASPTLFEIVRWVGAAYLVLLGFKLLLSAISRRGQPMPSNPVSGVLRRGLVTSLLNPKGLVFFLALLPQFVDPAGGQVAAQTFILALVFVAACFLVYLSIGLIVAAARARFAGSHSGRAANGIAGTVLIALGVRLALTR
jgi:threonine/homoserine/homoserine lactone efflux protein